MAGKAATNDRNDAARGEGFTPRWRPADHTADGRMVALAVMAVVVGTGGALGAWLLMRLIALATNLFWFGRLSFVLATPADAHVGLLVIAIPVLGSVIVGLMARFGSDKIRGHGIPEAIETILYGESRLSLKVAVLKPLSSAISIGSGGPFGAEGPIIMTGGAIGSLFAQCFHLSAAERKTLLVAGAAAGMTAIFATPLAAVLLAVEVLLFEWKPRSFVPVVVAALVAHAWRPMLLGAGPMFTLPGAALPGGAIGLAAALALGLGVGLEAAGLSWLLYRVEDLFHRLPLHWMWWPALGAVAVGLGGLADARVLGAGYGVIQALLDAALPVRIVIVLLLLKAAVWLIALGSGTSGGVLAPLLILGGAAGFLAGQVLPGDAAAWALLGMAAMMSGAMRAPLTGALFAAELTGRFDLLPLALLAAGAAYGASVLVMRRSILTEKIARRGRHILQELTVDPLDLVQVGQIMALHVETLPGTMTTAEATRFLAGPARYRSYPVVDAQGVLLGMVSRVDALRWQSEMELDGWGRGDADLPRVTLAEAVSDAGQPVVHADTPAGAVADLILNTGEGRLPVVDAMSGRVIGLVTRHDLLKARHRARHAEVARSRFATGPA